MGIKLHLREINKKIIIKSTKESYETYEYFWVISKYTLYIYFFFKSLQSKKPIGAISDYRVIYIRKFYKMSSFICCMLKNFNC